MKRYFHIDGDVLNTTQLAAQIGVNTQTVRRWISTNRYDLFVKKMGYIPRITNQGSYIRDRLNKGNRNYLVYEILNPDKYRFGIDVGFGDTNEEATVDFYRSRIESKFRYRVLFVSKNRNEVLKYQSMKIRSDKCEQSL